MFTAIEAAQVQGVRYASCKLPDGVTYMILLALDDDQNNPLISVPAFRHFQENLTPEGPLAPAARTRPPRQCVQYARERMQFGKPIHEFQGVSFMLADMATSIEAGRQLYLHAARLHDAGEPFTKQAAMAKLFCTDVTVLGGGQDVSCAAQVILRIGTSGLDDRRDRIVFIRWLAHMR